MRAGNSCKKSLSLRKFSVPSVWVFLLICCLVSPAEAVDFWDITVVDSDGSVGLYTSLSILQSGQPAISYYDATNDDLKYAWYDGSNWQTTTVDSTADVGQYTSLVILPSGYPAISYHDATNNNLKYAWHDGSAWQMTTVDSDRVSGYTSLAILPSGYPAISYTSYTAAANLKYAWFDGSIWQTTTADSAAGKYTSLAILPSGYPAISYCGNTNEDLKYAWYDGGVWHTTTVDTGLGYLYGGHTSLVILPSGYPAISYYDASNADLKYAWHDGSIWQNIIVDSVAYVGEYTSLAILPSGYPAISYHDDAWQRDLRYAWYDGSAWLTTTVDWVGSVGAYTSLVVFASGEPAISYFDWTELPSAYDLKFATPAGLTPPPVPMSTSYTATAWTEYGGTTIVQDGPAYNEGPGAPGLAFWSCSLVRLETTVGGHAQGMIKLQGSSGVEPGAKAGDANGTVNGTIVLGTSEFYPDGSELNLALEAIVGGGGHGWPEDYHLKLWRGPALLAEINPDALDTMVILVLAGESLTFELFASEKGGETSDYDRGFEFRLIVRGPVNFDGKGTVDFRDYAIFAPHWLDTGCSEPDWCGKTDLDKSGDVNWPDLKIFTDQWLE